MDTDICGLNKVKCIDIASLYEGQTVSITNTTNTWEKTISGGAAVFLIPSIPVPARNKYTVSVGTFSRTFDLGFGDSIEINLAAGYEPLNQKFVTDNLTANSQVFDFAYVGGKYGYNAGGSFHPFKTGAESFACYLGTGTVINVASVLNSINTNNGVYIDPNSLNNNNFVVTAGNGGSVSTYWNDSKVVPAKSSAWVLAGWLSGSYTHPSWNYSGGYLYVTVGSMSNRTWNSIYDSGIKTDSSGVQSWLVKSF